MFTSDTDRWRWATKHGARFNESEQIGRKLNNFKTQSYTMSTIVDKNTLWTYCLKSSTLLKTRADKRAFSFLEYCFPDTTHSEINKLISVHNYENNTTERGTILNRKPNKCYEESFGIPHSFRESSATDKFSIRGYMLQTLELRCWLFPMLIFDWHKLKARRNLGTFLRWLSQSEK